MYMYNSTSVYNSTRGTLFVPYSIIDIIDYVTDSYIGNKPCLFTIFTDYKKQTVYPYTGYIVHVHLDIQLGTCTFYTCGSSYNVYYN